MKKILPLLCLFAFLSPANSWAGKTYRVVVFADSVLGGYQLQPQDSFAAKLQKKIRAAGYDEIEVLNMSKPDRTTASATEEVTPVIDAKPDVVIIQLGMGDAKRGVVATATAYNLNTIVSAIKQSGAYVILAGIQAPAGNNERYRAAIAQNFVDVSTAQTVPLYADVMAGVADNPSLTLADGMHPNTVGVETIVENMFPIVDTGLRWRYQLYQHELEHNKMGGGAAP